MTQAVGTTPEREVPKAEHDHGHSGVNGGGVVIIGSTFDGEDDPSTWPEWAIARRMWNDISLEQADEETP